MNVPIERPPTSFGGDIDYLIVKRGEVNNIVAEFNPENLIFEQKVTDLDFLTRSLHLPKNKEWCVGIHCEELNFRVDLHGFFDDYNVRVGNMIKFYQLVMPSNVQSLSGRYFLIQCVKERRGHFYVAWQGQF